MRKIFIEKMIAGDFGGPLFAGNRLEPVGSYLGTPEWWNFGSEDEFVALLGYSDFEVALVTRDNHIVVERIGLVLWLASQEEIALKSLPLRAAKGIKVEMGRISPGMSFQKLQIVLENLGLDYRYRRIQDASERTLVVTIATSRCEMLFFRVNGTDGLAEIQFT